MKVEELARYPVVRGESDDSCWLCLNAIASGSECLLVPKDCDETAKMDAGAPFVGFKAHRACMERVP